MGVIPVSVILVGVTAVGVVTVGCYSGGRYSILSKILAYNIPFCVKINPSIKSIKHYFYR
jgi:hypothetical protein